MRLRAIRHAGSAGLSASSRRRARAAAPSGRSGARSSSCCSTCPIGRTSWTRRSSSAAAPPPLVQVLRRGYDRGVSQSRRAAVLREEPDRMRVSLRRAHGAVSGGRSPVRAHGARRQAPRCDRVSFGQARENARSPSLSSRRVPLRPASSHEVDEVAVKIGGGGVFPHVRRERHRYRALELLLGELRQARVPVAEVLPAACRPKPHAESEADDLLTTAGLSLSNPMRGRKARPAQRASHTSRRRRDPQGTRTPHPPARRGRSRRRTRCSSVPPPRFARGTARVSRRRCARFALRAPRA